MIRMSKTWQKIIVTSLLLFLAAIFFHSELSLSTDESNEAHHSHHDFCQLVNTTQLAKIVHQSRALLSFLPVSGNLLVHISRHCSGFARNSFSKNLFIENNSNLLLHSTFLI